jgi:hypothetical protein
LAHAALGISADGVMVAKGAAAGQGNDVDEQGDKILFSSAVPLHYWCKINSKAV